AQLQKGLGASERVLEILDTESEPVADNVIDQTRLMGKVDFKSVDFSYKIRPDIQVINGLDFSAAPGQTIAIVGRSGAGKSTVASLILQFYRNYTGQILFD